jgi:hypothetical protein
MSLDRSDLELIHVETQKSSPVKAAEAVVAASSCLWIASGLAKLPAHHGASLLRKERGTASFAMTALEYCSAPRMHSLPILVTLRGRGDDAVDVARSIESRGEHQALLVTGDTEGKAAAYLAQSSTELLLATATLPDRDSRLVNFKGILALSAAVSRLAIQAVSGPKGHLSIDALEAHFDRAAEQAPEIANAITNVADWRTRKLIVFSDGPVSELSICWQAILGEGGISNVLCCDIKDFTHGDHLALCHSRDAIALILRHGTTRVSASIVADRFAVLLPTIVLDFQGEGKELYWENLFVCCNVAMALAASLGYGQGRPPRSELVRGWRNWGRIN